MSNNSTHVVVTVKRPTFRGGAGHGPDAGSVARSAVASPSSALCCTGCQARTRRGGRKGGRGGPADDIAGGGGCPSRPTPTSCTATRHGTAAWTAHGDRRRTGHPGDDVPDQSLIAGWQGQHSLHGPALIITAVGEPALAAGSGSATAATGLSRWTTGSPRTATVAATPLEPHGSPRAGYCTNGTPAWSSFGSTRATPPASGRPWQPAHPGRDRPVPRVGHRGNLPRPALRHAATLSRRTAACHAHACRALAEARHDRHGRKAVCQAVSGRPTRSDH